MLTGVKTWAAAIAVTALFVPYAGAAAPWQQASGGPPGRSGAAMAYDPGAGRVVLFGGCAAYTSTAVTVDTKDDASTPLTDESRAVRIDPYAWCAPGDELADLWVRDGTTWSPVTVSGPAPYARYGASLTYDYTAHRLTLFGGLYQTDTATGPPAADADRCIEPDAHYGIQGTSSVHDENTGRDHTYWCFHDTWQLAYSGAAWTWVRLNPTASPPSRFHAGMSYDGSGHPVVVGGCHSLGMVGAHGSPTVPTYFDCAEYSGVETTVGARCPVPVVPVYSPYCGTTEYSTVDAWRLTWAGSTPTWTLVGCLEPSSPDQPPCGPTPARGAELAFDPATRTLFYWGGYYYDPNTSYNSYEGAAWSFDGTSWHELLTGGAQDQWCNSLSAFMAYGVSTPAYVGGRWQVLRTGGTGRYMTVRQQQCPTATADRWYDPTVDPAVDCPGHESTCPPIRRPTDTRAWDDTWRWDNTSCVPSGTNRMCWRLDGVGTPGTRVASSIAYDPVHGQVVVFGGYPGLADTWVYSTGAAPGDPCGCG